MSDARPSCCARRARRSSADDDFEAHRTRSCATRLERRPAGRSADRRSGSSDARLLRSSVERADRQDGAALRRGDAAAACGQRRDGRLPARNTFPLVLLTHRSDVRGALQPLRHAGDHASVRAAHDRQRADRERARHQRRPQRVRSGRAAPTPPSAARCGSRWSTSAARSRGSATCRPTARRRSSRLLRRGERGREPVGAAARRARLCRARRAP